MTRSAGAGSGTGAQAQAGAPLTALQEQAQQIVDAALGRPDGEEDEEDTGLDRNRGQQLRMEAARRRMRSGSLSSEGSGIGIGGMGPYGSMLNEPSYEDTGDSRMGMETGMDMGDAMGIGLGLGGAHSPSVPAAVVSVPSSGTPTSSSSSSSSSSGYIASTGAMNAGAHASSSHRRRVSSGSQDGRGTAQAMGLPMLAGAESSVAELRRHTMRRFSQTHGMEQDSGGAPAAAQGD